MAGFVKTRGSADGGDSLKAGATGGVNIPRGGTASRPSAARTGSLRYNTDTNKMEYYNGSAFVQISKEGNVSITQDSFTGDGSTVAFTMSTSVTSNQEQRVIIAVGNVFQNPASAYTVSGTTLTFTSAPGAAEPVTVIHGFDSTTF
jgi:hypothetical protein